MKEKISEIVAWLVIVGLVAIVLGFLLGINLMVWSHAIGWWS